MAGYLIRAQGLLDLAHEEETAAQRWLAAHPEAPISVSVIGVAMAMARVELVREPDERTEWLRRLAEIMAMSQARVGPPLPFDQAAASNWQWMLTVSALAAVPRVSLQEYAIASSFGLTVLEKPQAWHPALTALQLPIEALG